MRMKQLLAAGVVLGAVGLGAPSALAAGAKACPDGDCRKDAPGWGDPDAGFGTVADDVVYAKDGPGDGFEMRKRLEKGATFTIVCQARGTPTSGPRAHNSPWWDKTNDPSAPWVPDAQIDSGPKERAARECLHDEVPNGMQNVTGQTVERYVSWKGKPPRPSYTALRVSWTPHFTRKGGQWTTSDQPTVTMLGAGTLQLESLVIQGTHQLQDGVEVYGGVRRCDPATSLSNKVGIGIPSACEGIGEFTIKATVTHDGQVVYDWTMANRKTLGWGYPFPGEGLRWTDKVLETF